MSASAGTQAATSTAAEIFNASTDGACETITVRNKADSTHDLQVHVEPIHKADEFDYLEPGQSQPYRHTGGIRSVSIKTAGAATARWTRTAVL